MCEWADVEIRRVISGRLEEEDFTRLTSVCWKVAPAPIKVCDARNPGSFLKSLPQLVSEEETSYVVCEWELEGEELSTAKQWSLDSGMTFLCQAPWSV